MRFCGEAHKKNKDFVAKISKKTEMDLASNRTKKAVSFNKMETVRSSNPNETNLVNLVPNCSRVEKKLTF